jgi:hypothetical protein
MGAINGKPIGRPPHRKPKRGDAYEPGDEVVGAYRPERLIEMDERFCAAVESAISRGLEKA